MTSQLQDLSSISSPITLEACVLSEMEKFIDQAVDVLLQTLDKRDALTADHSVRVCSFSSLLGEAVNVSGNARDVLLYAALMHDYGKIGIPESLLWKDGRLTPEEYAFVKGHAKKSFDLLSRIPFTARLQDVPFVASCHHEKMDGTGYYRGLAGSEIPFLSRIIAVVDVFDALTSVRHYRNRMSLPNLHRTMVAGRGNHFDPELFDAFFSLPAACIVRVMESERGHKAPLELKALHNISLLRLIELCRGSAPKAREEDALGTFLKIYNAKLPEDYVELD